MRPCRMCGRTLSHDTSCESLRLQKESEKREQIRKEERRKKIVPDPKLQMQLGLKRPGRWCRFGCCDRDNPKTGDCRL